MIPEDHERRVVMGGSPTTRSRRAPCHRGPWTRHQRSGNNVSLNGEPEATQCPSTSLTATPRPQTTWTAAESAAGWRFRPTALPLSTDNDMPSLAEGGASSSRGITTERGDTLGRRPRDPRRPDDEDGRPASKPRSEPLRTLSDNSYCTIAVHYEPGEIATIREVDAERFTLDDLTQYEVDVSGLRELGGRGIMRWVKWHLGNMTIGYARVVDRANSPVNSNICAMDILFGMGQLGKPLEEPYSMLLGDNFETKIQWGGQDNPRAFILWPLQRIVPMSNFFSHPSIPVGEGQLRFMPAEFGILSTTSWNRFRRAGISRDVFDRHLCAHVNPLSPTPHQAFPALGAWLLGHINLASWPRSTPWPGRASVHGSVEPTREDRLPRLDRSEDLFVSTFNAINVNPSSTMPVITRSGRHHVIMTICPIAQDSYMGVGTYCRINDLRRLHATWRLGEAVYEVWPWNGSSYRMVRVVGEAWITVDLAAQGNPPQPIRILFKLIEDRNDSRMHMLESIVPYDIVHEYLEGWTRHRRSDFHSIAFFAQDINANLAWTEPPSNRTQSSSDDDPPAGGAASGAGRRATDPDGYGMRSISAPIRDAHLLPT